MRPINGGIPPQVSAFAGTLVNAARIGAQADDYAQFIVDQIDGAPQIEPAVREYLNSPTWFAQIVALYPEAQAHEPWFTTLRRAVIDALDAAPDAAGEGDDLTGAGGEDISGLEEGPYAPGGGRH